jgi:hypothetical protein
LGPVIATALVAAAASFGLAGDAASPSPARGAAGSATGAPVWYPIAGHTLRLETNDQGCWLIDRVKPDDEKRFKLDLQPPCYLLMWLKRPPGSGLKNADGVAVGDVGQPMAWRYRSAGGATALAVIGDPAVPQPEPDSLYQSRKRAGLHCTGSLQGIKLRGPRVRLQQKSGEGLGLYCQELGIEEKGFWLIAHD